MKDGVESRFGWDDRRAIHHVLEVRVHSESSTQQIVYLSVLNCDDMDDSAEQVTRCMSHSGGVHEWVKNETCRVSVLALSAPLPRALNRPALPLSRAWLVPSFGLDLIVHPDLSQLVLLELDLHYLHIQLHQSPHQPRRWLQDGHDERPVPGRAGYMTCATIWRV